MNNKNYDNGTDYHFISNIGEKLSVKIKSLNQLVFGLIESKPYKLDWEEIVKQYGQYVLEYNEIDISEFAYNYVIGYALMHKFSKDEALKEAMYLHLRAELIAKKIGHEI